MRKGRGKLRPHLKDKYKKTWDFYSLKEKNTTIPLRKTSVYRHPIFMDQFNNSLK